MTVDELNPVDDQLDDAPQDDPVDAPVFNAEVEREKIRAEEREKVETEFKARQQPEPTKTAAESAVPDRWDDPEGYDRYLIQQAEDRVMARVAPLLGVVNENTIESRFRAAGVGDAGLKTIKAIPGLNATQLNGPGFEILVNAAKYADIQAKGPERVEGVRGYSPTGSVNPAVSDAERKMYGVGTDISEADFVKMKKDRGITGDATSQEYL